jgi:toxin ParE1/3/4
VRLRFTPRATANIIEIADKIHANNPVAAKRVGADIHTGLQNLVLFPRAGRRQKVEGVRRLVTRKFRYLIYYTIDQTAEELVILNIREPERKREHQNS